MHPFEIPYRELLVGGLSCFAMCITILLTQRWHGGLSADNAAGVQKVHDQPTPRVGGLAIMFGLVMATLSAPNAEMFQLLVAMLLASLPAFLSGTLEDLSKRVGPMIRLWAAIASGVLGWWLTGYALTRVDIWGVDWALQWLPLAVIFTAFAVAGVANALNMIDGLNGLAGGVMLIAMAALSIIAHQVGDSTLAKISFVVGVTVLGFLVLNFPFGKLFLGDGGAYLLGFMGAWLAVMLPMRNPSISVWAPLLVFSYPILEVLFSILRRRLRAHHPCHPDRLHLHSLIYARLFRSCTKGWSKPLQNSFASLLPLCFMGLGSVLAVLFANSTLLLLACFVLMAVVYVVAYLYIIRFGHLHRRLVGPTASAT
jgi:UDP-N-acetylmuramyl pentapeptide phosphotransferase/UDP-N-acetylglucosamine-1-phosphate transferase